ncbi:MAG: hypothetical protein ACXWD3_16845, partial [Mycobacterium sp.]
MMKRVLLFGVAAAVAVTPLYAQRQPAPTGPAKITAVKAGRLIDPEAGTAAANQVILIEGEKITQVGANLAIPAGAEVIDLSKMTVLPGL